MRKLTPFLLIVFTLIFAALACDFPSLSKQSAAPDFTETVEITVSAEMAATATEPQAQVPLPTEPLPSQTPTLTETPTVTPTFTPSVPMARVNQNTNCRTGPGKVYDRVYVFMVGDEAEIVARSSVPNYVIIEVPDDSGRTCWLWMQYGEQTGSTDDLPERTPPPTPTPTATATPAFDFGINFDSVDSCIADERTFIRITNTGGVNIESHSVSAKNQDTSETVSYQSNTFGQSPDCITLAVAAINPGNSAYSSIGFTPPIGGDTINTTVKACAGDGLGEPCLTKSITFDVPSPSDVNAKENFEPVDNRQILEQVSELPIMTWNYTDANREGRHIGPMAQDFNEAFGVGEYEDHISTVDSYGVALAAIQALSDITEEQAQRIASLERQNEALQVQNQVLNARLDSLESIEGARSEIQFSALLPVLALTGLSIALLLGIRSKLKGRRRIRD